MPDSVISLEEIAKDNYDDQIINVKMPRKDYEIMRQLIRERHTMNNVTAVLKNTYIWIVASGILALYAGWAQIRAVLGSAG